MGEALHIVTGPMRSGTSFVCQLLEALGSDFGPKAELASPDRWNPLGYYERKDVIILNHRLCFGLKADASPWLEMDWQKDRFKDVRKFSDVGRSLATAQDRLIAARAGKMADEIASAANSLEGLTVKDPRFCLTLDAWKANAGNLRTLYCQRNDQGISRSIARQTGTWTIFGRLASAQLQRRFHHQLGSEDAFAVDVDELWRDDPKGSAMQSLFAFAGKAFREKEARDVLTNVRRTDLMNETHQTVKKGDAPNGHRTNESLSVSERSNQELRSG